MLSVRFPAPAVTDLRPAPRFRKSTLKFVPTAIRSIPVSRRSWTPPAASSDSNSDTANDAAKRRALRYSQHAIGTIARARMPMGHRYAIRRTSDGRRRATGGVVLDSACSRSESEAAITWQTRTLTGPSRSNILLLLCRASAETPQAGLPFLLPVALPRRKATPPAPCRPSCCRSRCWGQVSSHPPH